MGYIITVDAVDVVIPKKYEKPALRAVNDLFKPERLKKNASGGTLSNSHYSWVCTPEKPFEDLIEALAQWRYEAVRDEDGDIRVNFFTGEKLGDDAFLWEALAPFVNPGAEIFFHGEDGAEWKMVFRNGKMFERTGKIVYDGEKSDKIYMDDGRYEPLPKPPKRPTLGFSGPREVES